MKLMEKMKQKRLGNKGFSLVELIIVIAIMAILIGIVGTQVVPYLRRAREEKDMQIIDAFSTAAVTFYSLNTDLFVDAENDGEVVEIVVGSSAYDYTQITNAPNALRTKLEELTGYANAEAVQKEMSSASGKTITSITITYNFGEDGTAAVGTVTAQGFNGTTPVLELAISYIGSAQ